MALIGLLAAAMWSLVVIFVIGPFLINVIHLPAADLTNFHFIRNNINAFIQLLVIACFWVIPYEEIVFRGLALTVAGRYMRFSMAGLLTSVLFAAYHWQEGWSAVITIFLGAILSVSLYKKCGGNLWIVIFYHCAYDIILLSLLRSGFIN